MPSHKNAVNRSIFLELDSYRHALNIVRVRIKYTPAMDHFLFNGWAPLAHIAVIGLIGYVALILFLRLAGKRTLSRMNAYDMVMTMALGSVLTKAMLTPDQSVAETIFAIALLIFFQYVVSFAAFHWQWAAFLAAPSPTVLFHDGRYLQAALKKERVRQSEIEDTVKEKGLEDMSQVDTVILAANGEISVLVKAGRAAAGPTTVRSHKAGLR